MTILCFRENFERIHPFRVICTVYESSKRILLPMSVSEDICKVCFAEGDKLIVVVENNRCVGFRENRQDAISVVLAVKIGDGCESVVR